ncbi:MAG: Germination-specific N-acetylmuramoyl-L-alanine amidase [Cyanobacteria bacterium RYN_339]|nr:Germination-specific N-acetylmuramoyl-L-alanine amidase [Cyanobacteria bacterium RYN_339]
MSPPISRAIPLAVAALVLLAGGTGGAWWYAHRPVHQHLSLYYADPQGRVLVPVEQDVDFERPDAPGPWAQALFQKLATAPQASLIPAVGSRMTLVDAAWSPPQWTLTVKLPSTSGTTTETILAGALVRSYVDSYPGAKKVRLHLVGDDNKPFAGQHLDLSEALTPAEFANQSEAAPGASSVSATLWWQTKGGGELVPVKLPLTGGSGIPPRDAFEKLLAGPPAQAATFLEPVAPKGLVAKWAKLDGDVAQIDLDADLPKDAAAERFVKATVLTLTEFPTVKAVRFWRHDAPAAGTAGPFDLSKPIARPAGANTASTKGP